jgi:hypothetical protein
MERDTLYSLILLAFFGVVLMSKQFSSGMLELLMTLSRSGSTVLLLGTVLYLFTKGMMYTALTFLLLSLYLLKDLWVKWPASETRRMFLDMGKDQSRFNESTSVDLQWANRTAVHDSPNMLRIDNDASPLLLYPPSQATLESMSG